MDRRRFIESIAALAAASGLPIRVGTAQNLSSPEWIGVDLPNAKEGDLIVLAVVASSEVGVYSHTYDGGFAPSWPEGWTLLESSACETGEGKAMMAFAISQDGFPITVRDRCSSIVSEGQLTKGEE